MDELLPHTSEIDPKYSFLFSAPVADGDGNRTQVRYSRKAAEQYVMTEQDGKPTGWRAVYRNGAWQVEEGKSTSSTKPAARKKKAAPKRKAARKRS